MSQLLSIFSVFIIFLQFSQQAKAAECTEYIKDFDQVHSYRLLLQSKKCLLNLSSVNPPSDMIFRNYIVGDDGLFMIFNSYGSGPLAEDTGARVYYFFPRTDLPDITDENGALILQTASSLAKFEMNAKTAGLVSMSNGVVRVDPKIHPNNKGGVEILQHPGLILDVGFAMGRDPAENKQGKSVFEDPFHNRCIVSNSEIFKYSNGDILVKFSTDSELSKFLKARCPSLKVNF